MFPKKIKAAFLTIIALLMSFNLYAQSPGFEQQDVIKISGQTSNAMVNALTITSGQIQTTRVYIDGLGRPIQTVAVQASPVNNKDIVQPAVYNTLGQQTTGYLPYTDNSAVNPTGSFRTTAVSDQLSYYTNSGTNANPNKVANETAYPFSQQVFENSPLQRALSAGMPGLPGGKFKTVTYRLNNSTQDGNILIWSPLGTYTSGNYYADNSLSVTDGKDEDGVETLAFADAAGHSVLKRQLLSGTNVDTYYVYNLAGQVSYIVPPLALAKMLSSGDYNPNDAPVSTMVFIFVYDSMGRLIEKTVPAKGKMSIVYDPLNRPVLMQDALMNSNHQWNYIRYDVKGRAISQGIYVDNTNTSRTAMQTYVSSLAYTTYYETRNATQATGYYTAAVFPTTATGTLTPLAYAYFDDYKLSTSGAAFTYLSTTGLTGEETATTAAVKGMPTMVRKATVGAALTGDWLLSVTFYDKRLNPIQTRSNNQLNYSLDVLTDYKTTVPDFMGVPQIGYVKKITNGSTTTTVQTNLTYDYLYRVKSISQSYNGAVAVTIAAYTYNEMGQLVLKNLGLVSGTTYLQNLDMRYNIRGMLTSINNSTLTNDTGTGNTNGETTDVFGMTILYDKSDSSLGNTGKFDGKISAVKWMSKDNTGANTNERAYVYSYDQLNRYTGATYSERNTPGTGSWATNVGAYNETIGSYDVNGNIISLNRNSLINGAATEIDHLGYNYNTAANPNQLQSVSETNDANHQMNGFKFATTPNGTYSYDINGSLTADPNKGITNISYNYLNKTQQVKLSATQYINYTYDGTGNLIHKEVYGGPVTIVTDYIDGFVYNNNNATNSTALVYFPMPEGRVFNNGGTLQDEYIISDPQGNARVSFKSGTGGTATAIQENSYYPTGLNIAETAPLTPTTPNKNLYNGGSEWQNDYNTLPDYYQTFYRNYDAAIARWVAVDPMAESAESMTSYQYAGDNPVMYNDPMGNLKTYNTNIPAPPSYTGIISPPARDDFFDNADGNDAFVAAANAWYEAQNGNSSTYRGETYAQYWNGQLGSAGFHYSNGNIYVGAPSNTNNTVGSGNNYQYGTVTANAGGGTIDGVALGDGGNYTLHYGTRHVIGVTDANQGGTGPWERLLLPTSAWNTQLPDMTGCFRGCEVMTGTQPPLNHAVLINRHNPQSAIAGLTALGNMLESGHPVIVGVDYKPGGPNADGITDHFVVIAGYGEDSNGDTYLRFYDPGTAHFSNGTSPTNRFYIDSGGFLVGHTAYAPGRTYTISQVRLP